MSGHARRLSKLFKSSTGRTVIVPVDDGLIFGPTAGLEDPRIALSDIARGRPDAILAYRGVFLRHEETIREAGWIMNLSASTVLAGHTSKHLITSVENALICGADAVAYHINLTSLSEGDMLRDAGAVADSAQRFGVPLVLVVYPRRATTRGADDNYDTLRESDPDRYTDLVAHCARVAYEIGADLIKTQYTGSASSFERVIAAAPSIPVVIAGGVKRPLIENLKIAENALLAGARGVSFGRNVFSSNDRALTIRALKAVVHDGLTPEEAITVEAETNFGMQE